MARARPFGAGGDCCASDRRDRRRRSRTTAAVPFGLLECRPIASCPAIAGGLWLAGSGSNLPLTRELAREFERAHAGVRVVVHEILGTGGGARAVAAGAIDLGLASRSLSATERAAGLLSTPYARVAVVVAASASVADEGGSRADLIEIFAGRQTRWRNGAPVFVVQREPGDSSHLAVARALSGFAHVDEQSRRSGRLTDITLEDLRRAVQLLARAVLAELGLTRALEREIDAFAERTGMDVEHEIALGPQALAEAPEATTYRIVQEALTNVARHARASRIRVLVRVDDAALLVDGVGLMSTRPSVDRSGLRGMRERAELAGGSLSLVEPSSGGTQVRLVLPLGVLPIASPIASPSAPSIA